MNNYEKEYDFKNKLYWWIRFWSAVIVVSGFALAVAKWGMTRVSVSELDTAIQKVETKQRVKEIEDRFNNRMDRTEAILGNVRDNVIILMDRQGVKAKPLPEGFNKQLTEGFIFESDE